MLRCTLIWHDIGNYHAARTAAVATRGAVDLSTIEVRGHSGFREFRVQESTLRHLRIHKLDLDPQLKTRAVKRYLEAALEKQFPDVVFVPGWSTAEAFITLNWAYTHGVRVVMMSESTQFDDRRTVIKEAMKRRIVALANAALVGGTAHAAYIAKLGMPPERVFLGYDVVDNHHFAVGAGDARTACAKARKKHGLPERYFLCCARLIQKKNLIRLIDAYGLYHSRAVGLRWDLVIAGPGPMKRELTDRIERHGLEKKCHLVGAKSYSELPVYYGLASAFVLPSTVEPWGLVVNEAMAAGLPVLASDRCGCVRDLVHSGLNGATFNPFDVAAIASALGRISADSTDRRSLGLASKKIIAHWGPDRFAAGFEAAADAAALAPIHRISAFDKAMLSGLMFK